VCVCVCVCEWKRVVCCGMRLSLGFCDSSLFLMICFFFTAFLIAFYFFFPPCFPLFFWLAVSQNLFTLLPIFFSNLLPYSSHPRPSPPQPTAPAPLPQTSLRNQRLFPDDLPPLLPRTPSKPSLLLAPSNPVGPPIF